MEYIIGFFAGFVIASLFYYLYNPANAKREESRRTSSLPDPTLSSKMRRDLWIKYKWINMQSMTEIEPLYVCCGFREIEEAAVAAAQFDTMMQTEVKKKLRERNSKITYLYGQAHKAGVVQKLCVCGSCQPH